MVNNTFSANFSFLDQTMGCLDCYYSYSMYMLKKYGIKVTNVEEFVTLLQAYNSNKGWDWLNRIMRFRKDTDVSAKHRKTALTVLKDCKGLLSTAEIEKLFDGYLFLCVYSDYLTNEWCIFQRNEELTQVIVDNFVPNLDLNEVFLKWSSQKTDNLKF